MEKVVYIVQLGNVCGKVKNCIDYHSYKYGVNFFTQGSIIHGCSLENADDFSHDGEIVIVTPDEEKAFEVFDKEVGKLSPAEADGYKEGKLVADCVCLDSYTFDDEDVEDESNVSEIILNSTAETIQMAVNETELNIDSLGTAVELYVNDLDEFLDLSALDDPTFDAVREVWQWTMFDNKNNRYLFKYSYKSDIMTMEET